MEHLKFYKCKIKKVKRIRYVVADDPEHAYHKLRLHEHYIRENLHISDMEYMEEMFNPLIM